MSKGLFLRLGKGISIFVRGKREGELIAGTAPPGAVDQRKILSKISPAEGQSKFSTDGSGRARFYRGPFDSLLAEGVILR